MSEEVHRRPNILLVLSDDHAAHAIGAYGSVVNTTPHLDELAAAGVRFERCYATNSLCSPSRASILTGTYSHVNGVTTLDTPIDASQPTFASRLRDAGYRTAFVGKWHLGDSTNDGPGHDPQGFDYWDVLIGQGEYWDPRFLSAQGLRVEPGYATDVITRLSVEWLESVAAEPDSPPWCLVVAHKAPHRPWEPHPRHAGRYAAPIRVPDTFDDDLATRSDTTHRATMSIARDLTADDLKLPVPQGLPPEAEALWKYQRYLEDYLATVASVDDSVGELVGWLRAHDAWADTVTAYASDQGFFLGDHGWFDKRFMYEESLRMPLLLAYPGAVPPGQVYDDIATNVDFAQTFLDAAGVPAHPRMQGRSLWPDLTGGAPAVTNTGADAPPRPDGCYYRYWMHDDRDHHVGAHYGYRTRDHTLIYFYNDGLGVPGASDRVFPPEWELYDTTADPDQLRNVADEPSYRQVRHDLEVAMWQAQAAVGDAPHPGQPRPDGV